MPASFDPHDIVATNPGIWLETYGKVRDISGKALRVKMNVLQRRINAVHMAAALAGRPCRGIVVKPRKKGCSTMVGAIHYRQLCANPHEGLIVGNKADTSDIVFRMMRYFLEHDEFLRVRPVHADATSEKIRWKHRAMLSQETAHNAAGGRGGTPQFLHGTEVAHWQEGEAVSANDVLVSLLNSVPDEGFNEVWLESTPYGATGAFAETFGDGRWPTADECPDGEEYWRQWEAMLGQKEFDPLAEHDFVRVFAAWYEFDNSKLTLSDEQRQHMRDTIDAASWYRGEQALIDLYGNEGPHGLRLGREVECDVWEQLAWRRMVIRTKCKGNGRKFDEEYPRDPKTCFQASGSPVFDDDSLVHVQVLCRQQPTYGQLQMQRGAQRPVWVPCVREAANFWRWEPPKRGLAYLICADLAEGEDQTKGKDPDRHSIFVLRRAYQDDINLQHNLRVVARIAPPNRMPMYALVELVWLLHLYYGRALVIPEMNNSGMAFITGAKMKGIPIWQRREMDPHSGRERTWDGWRTTDKAEYGGLRSTIIWHLHQVLREKAIDLHCLNAHAELADFVDKGGRMEAGSGHDDDVLSLAIGVFNIDSATVYEEPVIERPLPDDIRALIDAENQRQGSGLAMRF